MPTTSTLSILHDLDRHAPRETREPADPAAGFHESQNAAPSEHDIKEGNAWRDLLSDLPPPTPPRGPGTITAIDSGDWPDPDELARIRPTKYKPATAELSKIQVLLARDLQQRIRADARALNMTTGDYLSVLCRGALAMIDAEADAFRRKLVFRAFENGRTFENEMEYELRLIAEAWQETRKKQLHREES